MSYQLDSQIPILVPSRRLFLGSLLVPQFGRADQRVGASIVMRLADRKILHLDHADFASRALLPPASTIKPLALIALLEAGKLRSSDEFACTRTLQIRSHTLNCVHPAMPLAMNPARAIAYSCNGAVAHFALRFGVDELPQALVRCGLTSQTGILGSAEAAGVVSRNIAGPDCQLQALGEEGVRVTPLELLLAYARLSNRLANPRFRCILEGLEGAVEFGTAHAAAVPRIKVAGKTGTILLQSGASAAWFAGFARGIALVVLTAGRSGGADAAPIARGLIERYA